MVAQDATLQSQHVPICPLLVLHRDDTALAGDLPTEVLEIDLLLVCLVTNWGLYHACVCYCNRCDAAHHL
eukprot:m.91052 g.91052  ORF g.91052 m.91052 type:complete len:70 (-) comp12936_c1_seq1:413-622(-)